MKSNQMHQMKISPLPRQESARLSITVSKPLMEALELYATYLNKRHVSALAA